MFFSIKPHCYYAHLEERIQNHKLLSRKKVERYIILYKSSSSTIN